MKRLTVREFFHSPAVLKSLHPGQSLVVTDKGEPSIVVTKAGERPRKTRADLEREAREICPNPRRRKVNFTEAIREVKGR